MENCIVRGALISAAMLTVILCGSRAFADFVNVGYELCFQGASDDDALGDISFETRSCTTEPTGEVLCFEWKSHHLDANTPTSISMEYVPYYWGVQPEWDLTNLINTVIEARFDGSIEDGMQRETYTLHPSFRLTEQLIGPHCTALGHDDIYHFGREGKHVVLYRGCNPNLASCGG